MILDDATTSHVLIIEKNESVREEIVASFDSSASTVHLSEAKCFVRAVPILADTKIDFIIVGPTNFAKDVNAFLQSNKDTFKDSTPVVVFYLGDDLKQRKDFESIQGVIPLSFPPIEGELPDILNTGGVSSTTQSRVTSNSDSNSADNSKKTTKTAAKETDQIKALAVILSRLSTRLEKVSEKLLDTPPGSSLKFKTIPEAVNFIILGATQLRRDKEKEDIEVMVSKVISKGK